VTITSGLLRVLASAASLAALAALWRYRPGWPDLPGAFTAPITTTLLQQLAFIAAWMLAGLLALLVLARSFRRAQPQPLAGPTAIGLNAAILTSPRSSRIRPFALRPVGAEARLLVVAPRETASSQPDAEVGPTARDPGVANRPLISLLGPLTIQGARQSSRGLRASALELIAFLALRREGAQRDEILEALWPGEDPKRSRHRLYQAVRDARRLLADALASERDRYWLDRTRVRVDVHDLEGLIQQLSHDHGAHRSDLLERALLLFRAEPLAGCDYTWSEGEARSLRGTYVELLELAGRARLEAGDPRGALDLAERGLAVDELNEAFWRLAMEAEGSLGLRQSLEERYERLRALLDERLGLEPQRDTRLLCRRLLGQN
jgi:DNA-binding SARP family transcriptional activator